MPGSRLKPQAATSSASAIAEKVGSRSPNSSPAVPSASAPQAGQARTIMPHRLSTRPRMAGSDALCTSVCTEMPCTEPAAPISAPQSMAKGKMPVATKPTVATACAATAPTARAVAPPRRPRFATQRPDASAPTPMLAVSSARPSGPRANRRST